MSAEATSRDPTQVSLTRRVFIGHLNEIIVGTVSGTLSSIAGGAVVYKLVENHDPNTLPEQSPTGAATPEVEATPRATPTVTRDIVAEVSRAFDQAWLTAGRDSQNPVFTDFGTLANNSDGIVSTRWYNCKVHNAIVSALFYNPSSTFHFTYGFILRSRTNDASNACIRIYVRDSGHWSCKRVTITDGGDAIFETLASGFAPSIIEGYHAENKIDLLLNGPMIFLRVNDVVTGRIEVPDDDVTGYVAAATQFLAADDWIIEETRFSEFAIYTLPN